MADFRNSGFDMIAICFFKVTVLSGFAALGLLAAEATTAQAPPGPITAAPSQAAPATAANGSNPAPLPAPRTTILGAWKFNPDDSDDSSKRRQESRGSNGGNCKQAPDEAIREGDSGLVVRDLGLSCVTEPQLPELRYNPHATENIGRPRRHATILVAADNSIIHHLREDFHVDQGSGPFCVLPVLCAARNSGGGKSSGSPLPIAEESSAGRRCRRWPGVSLLSNIRF